MESVIKWQTGEPKEEWCTCVVTTKSSIVRPAAWTENIGWTTLSYNKIKDVIAWCPMTSIEPYNEKPTKGVTAIQVKKEFIQSPNPKAIMNQFGFNYDKDKSFGKNCLDFLREKEENRELYTVWNAMHPDKPIRCLDK